MQLDVVIEQRFYKCINGYFWTANVFDYSFWLRYLTVFEQVNVVARVQSVTNPSLAWQRVDGKQVGVYPLPYYIGPIQLILKLPLIFVALYRRRKVERAVIYRIPGILSTLYHWFALSINSVYAAEVVGDPEDVFSRNASRHPLRKFFSFLFVRLLKKQCNNAVAISYVTEYSLQLKYPPSHNAFHTHYSSIKLMADDFEVREYYPLSDPLKIICVGNLSQPYKGCDFILHALPLMQKQGMMVELTWLGGGKLQEQMEELAQKLGVANKVRFLGNVSKRKTISEELDKADVFVLSSRQEGLPRVLIEAMARSLICVATRVGGVPELLPDEFIIERDNIEQLIEKLQFIYRQSQSERLANSKKNYDKASEYENTVLATRRQQMYQALKKATTCV